MFIKQWDSAPQTFHSNGGRTHARSTPCMLRQKDSFVDGFQNRPAVAPRAAIAEWENKSFTIIKLDDWGLTKVHPNLSVKFGLLSFQNKC